VKKYGYDPITKSLFTWDGEFQFGRVDSFEGEGVSVVTTERRIFYEMAGCHFLSGFQSPSYFFRVDDFSKNVLMMRGLVLDLKIQVMDYHPWESVKKWYRSGFSIALCGQIVKSPEAVAEFCRAFPCETVYVCPLVEELAAFGALVTTLEKESPRRANLFVPNTEVINAEFKEFDPKLAGDGLGRMASLVHRGIPVLNEMRTGPGISPFYGKIIHDGSKNVSNYIVSLEGIDEYFPYEPISARFYAATSVPVRMSVMPKFRKDSGCESEYADVFVASDYVPDLSVFMRFYRLMSGKSFVGISDAKDITAFAKKTMPVFRYNRAYKVSPGSI